MLQFHVDSRLHIYNSERTATQQEQRRKGQVGHQDVGSVGWPPTCRPSTTNSREKHHWMRSVIIEQNHGAGRRAKLAQSEMNAAPPMKI